MNIKVNDSFKAFLIEDAELIANKKYLVTCDNKVLRTNDQIDPVTSLLYHEGSKFQKIFKNIMSINIRKEW